MRLSWLQERVGSLAKHNSVTRDFRRKSTKLYVDAMMFTTLEWNASLRSDEFITEEEIDEARGKVDSSMQQVLEITKALATSQPPRNSLGLRISNHAHLPLHIARNSAADLWFRFRSDEMRDADSRDVEP